LTTQNGRASVLDRGDVDGKPANSHSSAASLGRLDNGFRIGDLTPTGCGV
jgi:hypothetical protein